jgi:hypothetical protein
MKIKLRLLLAGAILLLPAIASADVTFSWNFADTNTNLSASGTLTAALVSPGLYTITGGSGIVNYNGTPISATIAPCPSNNCTFVDVDGNGPGSGANLTVDNFLTPSNSIGSQITSNGLALTPSILTGTNPTYIGVWDSPSQYFYSYGSGGYDNLTTPFNVIAINQTSVPEPDAAAVLVTMLGGLGGFGGLLALVRRRKSA